MAAPRCPLCDSALTEAEATAGMCPDCAAPVAGGLIPEAVPVHPTATPVRGRWLAFPAGVIAGTLLALSAAGAWWAWGPGLRPADAGTESRSDDGESVAAAEPAARLALEAADQADLRRAAADEGLAELQALVGVAEERVAELRQEAAEAEALAQSARGSVADTRQADDKTQKAHAAAERADAHRKAAELALADVRTRLQAAQVQRGDLDRQLAAAQGRLQAAKGKEEQARQAEAEAQRARQGAERQLGEARTRLQTAQAQAAALDKSLEEKKAKVADRDRAIEAKKVQLADLDRAAASKRPRPRPPAVPPEAEPPGAFVREWLVIGPFADPDRTGHATGFPPEAEAVDPGKEYAGGGDPVRWRPHSSPTDYVDLAAVFKTQDPAVGYAVRWVRTDRARAAQLSLGSNDGIKVWVNGKLATDKAVSRSAAPGQDQVPIDLAAGWNELRVKVDNTGGPWGFYLELQEPGGNRPLTGLQFRLTPPSTKAKK